MVFRQRVGHHSGGRLHQRTMEGRDTGRSIARLAPLFGDFHCALDRRFVAGDDHLAGTIIVGSWHTSPCAASAAMADAASNSRPISAAMAPAPTGAASALPVRACATAAPRQRR
jgi:hypothetical protein